MHAAKSVRVRRTSSVAAATMAMGLAGLALTCTAEAQPASRATRAKARRPAPARVASPTTADLSVCPTAAPVKAKTSASLAIDMNAFRNYLSGTWVRELTWNGVAVQNNSALYWDLVNNGTVAMMFDQSNLGKGPMTTMLEAIKADPVKLAATPVLTFVDCQFNIVDKYYKVSSQFLFEGLPTSVPKVSGPGNLTRVFNDLKAAGFFKLDGTLAPAAATGGEMYEPSVGGALWQVGLRGTTAGADLSMSGQYVGAHVGPAGSSDVMFTGVENASFTNENGSYVSSYWSTDCAEFFDLPQAVIWERVVMNPQSGQPSPTPTTYPTTMPTLR